MHDAQSFLQNLALVFCVAALTTVVFHRLKQPIVFGYLLAGVIVGPQLPVPLVADEAMVRTLSELGVILLMFSLGLEFRLRRVFSVAGTSGLAALAETSIMLGLGFITGQALGWTTIESLFTGAMVAISSTTIIAKAFAERGVGGRVREAAFGILIVEDMIAILLVAILTALATSGAVSAGMIGRTSLRLATFLAVLIGTGSLVVPRLVRMVVRAGQSEMTLVASVGICFAGALAALAFGYSVALGAFIAGSLVAESGETKAIEHLIEPVRDLFLAIFFVSVGMLIDPRAIADHWGAVVALTLVVVAGKIVAVTAGAFLTGNGLRTSLQVGMSLAQIGEFSFIIASVGTSAGAIRPQLYSIAIAVSAVTTLTTPWLIRAAGPLASSLDRNLPKPIQTFVALYGSWIERMRESPHATGGRARIRRLIRLLALDAVLLAFLIIGVALEMDRFTNVLHSLLAWPEQLTRMLIVAASLVTAIPLVIGLVGMCWRLAMALAVRAMPTARIGAVDFARAPRDALVVTLQAAILLAIIAPLTAVTQPFLRGVPVGVAVIVTILVLAVSFWRAARDLQGHARAGAEVIASALAHQTNEFPIEPDPSHSMENVNEVLPGLGGPASVIVAPTSSVAGRTLSQVNLRGLTGATVICIFRPSSGGQRMLLPTGHEQLHGGDVLALAGSQDAISAARAMLG
jgi:monovalent cation:H+ antiporter-2, CPA2 family